MAKAGDKRRLEQNAAHLRKLRLLIAVANVAFIVVRLVLKRSSARGLLYWGLALTSVLYAACYRSISSALSPTYSADGELLFSGQDLSLGGALSYFHDVVYISAFVQLLGCLTDYAWYTFLLIPGYALYALTINVLIPYWNRPKLDDMSAFESEADRKRREKKERQSARAQKFAARR